MASFPKCLNKLENTAHTFTGFSEHQQFKVEYSGTVLQASIEVTDQEIVFIMQQPFVLERGAQLVPQYSQHGNLLAVGLECGTEKLVVRDTQSSSLEVLYEQLKRRLSVKGFNDYYKPLKRLGRGNFASVYLVQHKFTKKLFAAKVFGRCQQYLEIDGKAALENEIRIMRQLRHPYIMNIESVHETDNLVYLIVEYMGGGTLEDYMRSRLHLTGEEICKIIKHILEGLKYLSSKGIMHRDIKPSNIMQRKDTGEWVLTDFGLAACTNTNYLYQKCGTPGFIAPEILRLEKPEEKYTQTCDIFSFGVIIYTLIVGKMPFQCQDEQAMYETNKKCDIKLPEKERQELHPDIIGFLLGMLEADPTKRLTPDKALEANILTKPEVSLSLVQYFQSQRERAMKKVLQFANGANQ